MDWEKIHNFTLKKIHLDLYKTIAILKTLIAIQAPKWELFLLFLNHKYVVGTQKNRLNEMILLST